MYRSTLRPPQSTIWTESSRPSNGPRRFEKLFEDEHCRARLVHEGWVALA